MIHLTRIQSRCNGIEFGFIEGIEATPDTLITLTNAQKIMVLDLPKKSSHA